MITNLHSSIDANYGLISNRTAAEQNPNYSINEYIAGNMNLVNHEIIALQQAMAGTCSYSSIGSNYNSTQINANSVINRGLSNSQSNGLNYSDAYLPPGYRFHPTDEELIVYYLANKLADSSFTVAAIAEADLNKCEPWDLPEKAKMGEKEWYFYSLKDRKYPTGLRTNRATLAGYWKATGKDKEIRSTTPPAGRLVGMKKTLVFYCGRAPRGQKSDWVMHEYRLEGEFMGSQYNHLHFTKCSNKDEWTVCRVFKKSSGRIKDTSSLSSAAMAASSLAEPLPALQESPQCTVAAAYNNKINHTCEDSGTTDHESTSTDQYCPQNQNEINTNYALITAGYGNRAYTNSWVNLLNAPNVAEGALIDQPLISRRRDMEFNHFQTRKFAQKIYNHYSTNSAKIAVASTNSIDSCCNDDIDDEDSDGSPQKQKQSIALSNAQKKLADQLLILHNINSNPMINHSTVNINNMKINDSSVATVAAAQMEDLETTKTNYNYGNAAAAEAPINAGPICYETELRSIVHQYTESAMKLCKDETSSRVINTHRPNLEPYSCQIWYNHNNHNKLNTEDNVPANYISDVANDVINTNPKLIKPQPKITMNQNPTDDSQITASQQLISSSSMPGIWSSASAYYDYYINNSN